MNRWLRWPPRRGSPARPDRGLRPRHTSGGLHRRGRVAGRERRPPSSRPRESRVSTMSTGFERPIVAALRHELGALRGNWFWFVLLGIALVVLGTVALGYVVIASLA